MKIGIVNDLEIAVEALSRAIGSAPEHQVVWIARNGAKAVELCARQLPDLVLMDLVMPGVDGVEAIRRIMSATPCAILVVTATVSGQTSRVFKALGAGALDAVDTPVLAGPGAAEGTRSLLAKIAAIGKIIHPPSERTRPPGTGTGPAGPWLFALGASAGGPTALTEVLGGFSCETPAAFVVIQHLDRKFAPALADWLGKQISLPVRLARDGDVPTAGTVLLPDRDDHLILSPRGALHYTADPESYVYRPSVDAFFQSIADHWRGNATGVVLTGMGRDGGKGLKKMREAGFATIAQDQKSSAVYGMPKAAALLGAAERILPLAEIGPALRQQLGGS